jgi:hypothetical protein
MFQDWLVKQAVNVLVPVLAQYLAPYLTLEAKKQAVAYAKAQVGKTGTPFDDYAVEALARAWGV